MASVLEAELAEAPAEPFVRACDDAVGGNPLLLAELIDELKRRNVRPTEEAAPAVRGVGPRTVAETVRLRLAALPAEAMKVATAVAVLGDDTDVGSVSALSGLDLDSARTASDQLIDAWILRRSPRLSFAHPIVRQAIYEDMGPNQRAHQHALSARLLAEAGAPVEQVAAHLVASEPEGDSFAVEQLRVAGLEGRRRGAPQTSCVYLRRALREPPPECERAAVLAELGSAECQVGDPDGIDHLREALAYREDVPRRLSVARELAVILTTMGRIPEALEVLEAELLRVDGDDRLLLEAELVVTGQFAGGAGFDLDRLEPFAGGLRGTTPGERLALAALAFRHAELQRSDASELAELALAGQAEGSEDAGSGNELMAVLALIGVERLDVATRWVEGALADAAERGSVYQFGFASLLKANIGLRQGNLRAAEADARDALSVARQLQLRIPEFGCLADLTDVLLEQGDAAAAVEEFARSEVPEELPFCGPAIDLLKSRGKLRIVTGNVQSGIDDLRAAAAGYEAWGIQNPGLAPWRPPLAVALSARDEALELAEEELRLARLGGAPRLIGAALCLLGRLTGGPGGMELLHEAVKTLEKTDARLDHARALIELGSAFRRANERSRAQDLLRRGLDLASRCGAGRLMEQARVELLAAGGRARRLQVTGVDSLTASERRVAHLAARGSSNREIAQALFVTENTIETHLKHAFAKLHVRARRELATVFSEAQ